MNQIRIQKIEKIVPYKINYKGTDGILREIDFSKFEFINDSIRNLILNENVFLNAKIEKDFNTIYWEINGFEYDFCPDVLLENSKIIDKL